MHLTCIASLKASLAKSNSFHRCNWCSALRSPTIRRDPTVDSIDRSRSRSRGRKDRTRHRRDRERSRNPEKEAKQKTTGTWENQEDNSGIKLLYIIIQYNIYCRIPHHISSSWLITHSHLKQCLKHLWNIKYYLGVTWGALTQHVVFAQVPSMGPDLEQWSNHSEGMRRSWCSAPKVGQELLHLCQCQANFHMTGASQCQQNIENQSKPRESLD